MSTWLQMWRWPTALISMSPTSVDSELWMIQKINDIKSFRWLTKSYPRTRWSILSWKEDTLSPDHRSEGRGRRSTGCRPGPWSRPRWGPCCWSPRTCSPCTQSILGLHLVRVNLIYFWYALTYIIYLLAEKERRELGDMFWNTFSHIFNNTWSGR